MERGPDTREAPTSAVVCGGCGKAIGRCRFCDEPDCASAACFTCVVLDLRESAAPLHEHGG